MLSNSIINLNISQRSGGMADAATRGFDHQESSRFSANRVSPIVENPNEYQVQVKSAFIPLQTVNLMKRDKDFRLKRQFTMGLYLEGGEDNSIEYAVAFNEDYRNIRGFLAYLNDRLKLAYSQMRLKNPTWAVGNFPPFFDYIDEKLSFYVEKDHINPDVPQKMHVLMSRDMINRLSFSVHQVYDNPHADIMSYEMNLDGLNITDLRSYTVQGLGDVSLYRVHSHGLEGLNDVRDLIIQTSTIPVNPELKGKERNDLTSILRVIKLSVKDVENRYYLNTFRDDDYYDLDSSIDLKNTDIELRVRYVDGTDEPLDLQGIQDYSLQLRFMKKF